MPPWTTRLCPGFEHIPLLKASPPSSLLTPCIHRLSQELLLVPPRMSQETPERTPVSPVRLPPCLGVLLNAFIFQVVMSPPCLSHGDVPTPVLLKPVWLWTPMMPTCRIHWAFPVLMELPADLRGYLPPGFRDNILLPFLLPRLLPPSSLAPLNPSSI